MAQSSAIKGRLGAPPGRGAAAHIVNMSPKPTFPAAVPTIPLSEVRRPAAPRGEASPQVDGARPSRRRRSTRLVVRIFGIGRLSFTREDDERS